MKLIKILAATGVLLVSFAVTSYIVASYTAAHQEQNQDDFINSIGQEKVVELRDPDNKRGGGTGFLINSPSGNTYIMTNNHVCGLADSTGKLLVDGDYYAHVISHFADHDLCLVSNPLNLSGIDVGDSSRDGENVYVVGHPLLEPRAEVKGQISGTMVATIVVGFNIPCEGKGFRNIEIDPESIMAAFGIKNVCVRDYEAQATTVNILPGNSGSPVLNRDGKVVGVAFAGREDGPGRGYIIPLKYIKKFLENK